MSSSNAQRWPSDCRAIAWCWQHSVVEDGGCSSGGRRMLWTTTKLSWTERPTTQASRLSHTDGHVWWRCNGVLNTHSSPTLWKYCNHQPTSQRRLTDVRYSQLRHDCVEILQPISRHRLTQTPHSSMKTQLCMLINNRCRNDWDHKLNTK